MDTWNVWRNTTGHIEEVFMQLNSKVYDILKWITMIVLPACATAYVGLAAI